MTAPNLQSGRPSKGQTISGWVITGLVGLFLVADAIMKLMKPRVVVEGTVQLGYQESVIVPLGIVLLTCTLLYLWPRTAVLGAVLLSAYLGGAVATHVHAQQAFIFPIAVGVLVWASLCLRSLTVRKQLLTGL